MGLSFDPALPADAPAGSALKIAIMTARAARKLPLFVAGDSAALARAPRPETGPPTREGGAMCRGGGITRLRGKWRVRVWVPEKKRKVSLGVYVTYAQAWLVLTRTRAEMRSAKAGAK